MKIKLNDDLIELNKTNEIFNLLNPIVLPPFTVYGPYYHHVLTIDKKIDTWWKYVPILGQIFTKTQIMEIKINVFNSIFDVDIHVSSKDYFDFAEKLGLLIEDRIQNVKVTIVKDYLEPKTMLVSQ